MALLPLRRRHAIEHLARVFLTQRDAALRSGFLVPTAETIATKPGEVHQIDVLNVRAFLDQMFAKRTKSRCFQLGSGLLVDRHGHLLRAKPCSRSTFRRAQPGHARMMYSLIKVA